MGKDEDHYYGRSRYNILAAFINSVYLTFTFLFTLADNIHHIIEHWGIGEHHHSHHHDHFSHLVVEYPSHEHLHHYHDEHHFLEEQ